MADGITPRSKDFAKWYQDVIRQGDLAEPAEVVRGCMVIKPHGYAIWEKMQRDLDRLFKATGHDNAYFPLLHPAELPREGGAARRGLREGVRGRHALRPRAASADGKLDRRARQLEEPFVIRPTSETIIGHFFAQVDPELPRPAAAHQPVGQRRALGDAHAAVPAHHRVPLAGGPHRPRHARGGAGGGAPHARGLRRLRRGRDGDAGDPRREDATARSSPARSRPSASRR